MKTREEELSSMFKHASKVTSEFEKETLEMVEQLRSTRDEQVSECLCITLYMWNGRELNGEYMFCYKNEILLSDHIPNFMLWIFTY